jgi:hypothetical protein
VPPGLSVWATFNRGKLFAVSANRSAEGFPLARPEATRLRNARIAHAARVHRFDAGVAVPFICECSEDRCEALMRLTLGEFMRLRASCDYLVSPGHQVSDATIVRVKDGVWLYRDE